MYKIISSFYSNIRIDVSKTSSVSTTESGLKAVDNNAVSSTFVHLAEFFSKNLFGWSSVVAVGDINDHLLPVEEFVVHVFAGTDGDGHCLERNKISEMKSDFSFGYSDLGFYL